jgi:hypothetical protein
MLADLDGAEKVGRLHLADALSRSGALLAEQPSLSGGLPLGR